MRASLICFTLRGALTAMSAAKALQEEDFVTQIRCKKKGLIQSDLDAVSAKGDPEGNMTIELLEGSLQAWCGQCFEEDALIVFVGATGIAVRTIAPFLRSKTTDPAVVCMDEQGRFAISLISGHIGGANDAAELIAERTGAVPVVTTATDGRGMFAVDAWAKQNGLEISDMKLAKAVSAEILDGKKILLESELPVSGSIPKELIALEDIKQGRVNEEQLSELSPQVMIHIGAHACTRRYPVLYLVPKTVTLGVGCRKDKNPEELRLFVTEKLLEEGILPESVAQICSIDLKAEEKAIIQLAEKMRVPFRTFTGEELMHAPGEYTASEFVRKTTGADNVCERSAVLGSGGGKLLLNKYAENGMTLAAAAREWRISFE